MRVAVACSRGVRNREDLLSLAPLFRALAVKMPPKGGFVAVNWIGARAMAGLNGRFRGRPGAAEILTFPAAEGLPDPSGESPRGEIYLCWMALAAGARRRGVPERAYAARLFVHGLFHLRGYRHDTDGRRDAMERAERRFLRAHLPARVLERLFA
jgi:rRNA maturation RNase YbeY